jgi:hypothetical protein
MLARSKPIASKPESAVAWSTSSSGAVPPNIGEKWMVWKPSST